MREMCNVYWANNREHTIGRANIDGSGANRQFIPGGAWLGPVAVDAQHVYWTYTYFPPGVCCGSGKVGRANLDGTDVEQSFITTAQFSMSGVGVDGQHIYWDGQNSIATSGAIGRANLDGTDVIDKFINVIAGALTVSVPVPAPISTSPPTIAGIPQQGQTLTERHATWINGPSSFTYRWQRCDSTGGNCASIPGVTGESYQLTAADLGKPIRAQETASNAGGDSAAASSAATGVVGPTTSQITPRLAPRGKGARILTLLKKGHYTLSFKTFGPGRLLIGWYYVPKGAKLARAKISAIPIAGGKTTFSKASTIKLKIKLTPKGKRLLKHAKRLTLTVRGTYTPTGSPAIIATKTFTLKR